MSFIQMNTHFFLFWLDQVCFIVILSRRTALCFRLTFLCSALFYWNGSLWDRAIFFRLTGRLVVHFCETAFQWRIWQSVLQYFFSLKRQFSGINTSGAARKEEYVEGEQILKRRGGGKTAFSYFIRKVIFSLEKGQLFPTKGFLAKTIIHTTLNRKYVCWRQ